MTSPARPGRGDAWTVDDLQDLPEDGQDYEIFDGSLLVSPHADVFHGAVANRLRRMLDRQAPAGLLVGQDIGVSAKRSSYFVPDLFVAREDALDRGGPALDPGDVLLVVEVISPSNAGRDLVLKRHEYGVAGIPRYWLVEPRKRTLTVLENVGGFFREAASVGVEGSWRTDQPFPLVLTLADLI
ncbi:Endonuclease, Uma2 family (restriction endonuclease fold) [Micromonospora rhizosphaerae]|uniref:Endonuclease, Uma2 family (Restriction endonuclease fold) n=1 Tax=Micromonospora rhizosphaerae TaxID=568872 RepID=A0A1C6REF0_9ACTN|nr:Uma2 family endonuclease [Micromonospora rhizosphaerae]SCL15542.1 Endonuclease, Uma2 family (restriction endonuclease fold) [Micromonospora rhizosphaerae]